LRIGKRNACPDRLGHHTPEQDKKMERRGGGVGGFVVGWGWGGGVGLERGGVVGGVGVVGGGGSVLVVGVLGVGVFCGGVGVSG